MPPAQALCAFGWWSADDEKVHGNPGWRGRVASPEHWRYSSAHEWMPGSVPVISLR